MTLRCTGRLADPDDLTVKLTFVDLKEGRIVAEDVTTRRTVDLTIHRSGTGALLLCYQCLTFGNIEVVDTVT